MMINFNYLIFLYICPQKQILDIITEKRIANEKTILDFNWLIMPVWNEL